MQNEETVVISDQPTPEAASEVQKADALPEGQPEGEAKAEGEQKADETPEQHEAKKELSKNARRIANANRRAAEAAAEAKFLRERVAALEAATAQKPVVSAEPKREDFEDFAEYVKAAAAHVAKTTTEAQIKADREASEQRGKQSQAEQSQRKIADSWMQREAEFKATTPDYEETVTEFVENDIGRFSEGSRRLLVESDVGPALLHFLANNHEEADRIAELSPLRQVVELGKLEDKIPKPTKPTSKAPPPPEPVRGGVTGQKDPSKMSVSEYKAFMAKNGSRYVRAA